MTNANYCKECNETLTLHADGTITCSCNILNTDQPAIPPAWILTEDERAEAVEGERERESRA